MKQDLPPLAQYRSLDEYRPVYGDYVVWAGWVSCWHGIVVNYNDKTGDLYIIFSGLPRLLFTMDEKEQEKETQIVNLQKIKNAATGSFAIQQHDRPNNAIIWYI